MTLRPPTFIADYPRFLGVIRVLGAGYQCVTLPFALPLRSLLRMSFGAQVLCFLNLCSVALYAVKSEGANDLHALDTPPAFILSQDQTLKEFFTRFTRLVRVLYPIFKQNGSPGIRRTRTLI